ncbi:hypothetical protein MLD38_023004 [Melastoma candidum]|uniref:Uncharacterized protein n=1 Tax=Melastoma candidum TaxID=119954 RepID=A0ACB9QMX8_9MYRT|nr:hypothetical protein MLD38_023004 [Melastoma candidum]
MSHSDFNPTTLRRDPSVEFWVDGDALPNGKPRHGATSTARANAGERGGDFPEDPPSALINKFLHKQRASGEYSLDIDFEISDELPRSTPLTPLEESPNKADSGGDRVSFLRPVLGRDASLRRRRGDSRNGDDDAGDSLRSSCGEEIRRCLSKEQHSRLLQQGKPKSRLLEPLDAPDKQSGRVPAMSGQLFSGILGKGGGAAAANDDDNETLWGDDLPEEYKKVSLSVLTLIQMISLIVIVSALACTLAYPKLQRFNLWSLQLWRWEVLILVLICGRLVSGWVIRLIVLFIERSFLLRKRVLYFVYGVRSAVQNCLWLGLTLIAWHALFDKRVAREMNSDSLNYVTKVLVCFLVGTLLWLIKTLIIKVLASSFHVSTYFDRIRAALFNQYLIETLSGLPVIEIRRNEEEGEKLAAEVRSLQKAGVTVPLDLRQTAFPAKSGRLIGSGVLHTGSGLINGKMSRASSMKGDGAIDIDRLHKLHSKNVSAWNMKRLMNIVRHGSLSTLDEQILDSANEVESPTSIRTENEAKAAARKIFHNVSRPGAKFIYLEDLLRFLREDEALRAMNLFEGACDSQKISKSCLKNWVVNVFRERKALALTLNDTKTAVNRLHHVANAIVAIVVVIVSLLILGIATYKVLVFFSSQLLLVAFMFGNTCKNIFESIIFLFVIHPFDVGDRCQIDGVELVVEEMNILTTVFLRDDNMKIVYPNSTLTMKAIGNFHRSPDMGDAVEFLVHLSTPAEKIAIMKQRILSYMESKKEHWAPGPMLIMKDMDDLNRVRFALWFGHRMNHQDMGEKWARRALLVEEMVNIFKDLDLQYRLFPIDINVRSMPVPSSARVPPGWGLAAAE